MVFQGLLSDDFHRFPISAVLMQLFANICTVSALGMLLIASAGCGDRDSRPRDIAPEPAAVLPIANPVLELPPALGRIALTTTQFDLQALGFRESEFFVQGEATSFTALNEFASDGLWQAEAADTAAYKTRIVVIRPEADSDFSGTVFVEWLNVSSGFDNPPSWYQGHTEVLRRGHAWVFVSAQAVGIEGSDDAVISLAAKRLFPERYESLSLPSDSFSYDIFSQVAQAIRYPEGIDPLDGLNPQQLLALGQSQSAQRLLTYINAVHPMFKPYDAYLVHSRYAGSAPLSQEPQIPIPSPPAVTVRSDLGVPVLMFQTETDVLLLDSLASRQADSETFRLWETAGTSHADYYSSISGRLDTGSDADFAVIREASSVFGFINCDRPMNAGPQSWLFNAALNALEQWVREGLAPANAERLETQDDGSGFSKDAAGNVLGGIRSPYADTPAAQLSGEGQTGESFCGLFGTTALFDAATMASLYVDRDGYIAAVRDASDAAVAARFLLPEDAQRIVLAAGLQWDMLP
ncbi:MAG: hypothetical protein ACJA09_000604 [Alcanivorax sp.]